MLEQTTPQLAPKERCTGCGACANGCPRGAIHMLPDREGFLYPTVTDACIQCGHCSHICPVRKQREPRPEPAVFAAWNTDEAVRRASTAGGVFSTLADYILESGGVVFGAATDEQLHVRHIAVHSAEELPRLRGTKPVQSEIGDCYQKVRYYLDRGRRVLFSGTPCQVDGLYRYLGEHPENLLTCDVLCSGAASPGVWAHLLQTMAYIKQHEPLSVQFFGKLPGERERRFHVAFQGGGVYDAPIGRSDFGRGLLRGLFLRPACHACPYVTADRPGDLTLGLFHGLPKDFYPEEQKRGVSLLLVNSPKGAHVFDTLPLKRELRTLEEAVAGNPALRSVTCIPAERSAFFEAFVHQPFHQVQHRFLAASRPRVAPAEKAGSKRGLLQRLLRRKEK